MSTAWPPIDPQEIVIVTFDYASELTSGETISSASVSVALVSGPDPTPSSMLSGSPTIAGALVYQLINGRPNGSDYKLRCVAAISPNGRQLVRSATVSTRYA